MKKISVEHAINNGAWYEYKDGEIIFRVRFLNFRQVQLSEIDNIEKTRTPIKEGKLFLLSMELINLSKKEESQLYLRLMDGDGFKFNSVNDNHITIHSDFAKRLTNKWGNFIPKFKYFKDEIFLVPNEETKYFLAAHPDASLTEI